MTLFPSMKIDGDTVATMPLPDSLVYTGLDGDEIQTSDLMTWKSEDGSVETGIWGCQPGRFRTEFTHNGEMITIIGGELACIGDDGSAFTLMPGDSMTFPRGWKGEWHVKKPLRKVYATFTAI